MSPDINNPKTIKFIYENANDYRIVHGTGVYGGVTPNGELKMDFFTEFNLPIVEESFLVKEDGSLGERTDPRQQEPILLRQKQVGIVLSLNTAEIIASWMLQRIEEFKKLSLIVETKDK